MPSFTHTSDSKENTALPLSSSYLFFLNKEPKVNLEALHPQARLCLFVFLDCSEIYDRVALHVKCLCFKYLPTGSKSGLEVTIK